VRTLVVSDLHLGARLRRDVLRRAEALEALLAALEDVERLVLLGDVVELLEGRPERAMEVAEPVLRAVAARLGRGREVVLVPGNHDAALVGRLCDAGVPALVVFGDHEEVGLTADERQALDACPHVAMEVVAGATHFLVTEEPRRIAELILQGTAEGVGVV